MWFEHIPMPKNTNGIPMPTVPYVGNPVVGGKFFNVPLSRAAVFTSRSW